MDILRLMESLIEQKNYDTAEQAAIERDKLAVIHHKEFAYLNFPELLNNYISEINNV